MSLGLHQTMKWHSSVKTSMDGQAASLLTLVVLRGDALDLVEGLSDGHEVLVVIGGVTLQEQTFDDEVLLRPLLAHRQESRG